MNTELRPWTIPAEGSRRAGLSAFGFGGTNFHAVLEEYIPHKLNGNGKRSVAVGVSRSRRRGKRAASSGCRSKALCVVRQSASEADIISRAGARLAERC